ncbi:phosphate acetyltransferase [Catalinimonas alkaloidigena]|uniref:Phosphate acetyltransferase n=2 Tax=Catalinimonas alkaloidigena TaxID=1075417 RepID=A0A1G9RN02_9BACT|nr:phosphate acetyltransferase [Catalinimonas alkaloidigena]
MVVLGVLNRLLGNAERIGYFKPIINHAPALQRDVHIETVLRYFDLPISYEATYAYTRDEALKLAEEKNTDELIDTIIRKYKRLEEEYEFIIVEGSDFVGSGVAFEFGTNVAFAKNLNAPAIVVVSGAGKSASQVVNAVITTLNSFQEEDVQVLAAVANKVDPALVDDVRAMLPSPEKSQTIFAVIPEVRELKNPTMQEVFQAVGGQLLFGEDLLSQQVDLSVVGAMQIPNFLPRLRDNTLIVTPGDRADIIIGALQANISLNYPKVSGIVLTGGFTPDESILKLIEGLQTVVPIISVDKGTFQTANEVGDIQSRITPGNTKKIELAISTFEKYMDLPALDERIITFHSEGLTPRMFQYQLVERAKQQKRHIVLPEGNDDRILTAAARLIQQEIVDLTILGDPTQVAAAYNRLGIQVDLERLRIVNPTESPYFEDYVETFYELRKTKNVNHDMARDMMTDVSYFGTMMVYKGHADGMVSGAVHTTQHTIRPALQFVKTKPGFSVVSSVFFMCLPERVAVFGDCAVNPNPNAEQLAEIAIASADTSLNFGIEPRIAMLSYSSGSSGQGEEVEKVRKATELVKARRPDLKVEGPIQYDAAVDPVVGQQKMPNSIVAGQASVLIFPDLNTGNNTYKAVQRETGALAIGPVLQGLNKPVNDLSRGCTVADIFNTVVITAIQSQE